MHCQAVAGDALTDATRIRRQQPAIGAATARHRCDLQLPSRKSSIARQAAAAANQLPAPQQHR